MPHSKASRNHSNETALVTGANTGLGFETAAQLALEGYGRVFVVARTLEKATVASKQLKERTERDVFSPVEMEAGDGDSVRAAVSELSQRSEEIDVAILNAGLIAGPSVKHAKDGTEITFAASLTGHHSLTTGLLNAGCFATGARVVISCSEAARGDVPMMGLTDLRELAKEHTAGDLKSAVTAIAHGDSGYTYKNMPHYANVKLFVAHWAAAISRHLPSDMSVFAVSPGATTQTEAMRHQPWLMKLIMGFMMAVMGKLLGMSWSMKEGARRYLDALGYPREASGKFFASIPGKMVGKPVVQEQAHVVDRELQEATWNALIQITGSAIVLPGTDEPRQKRLAEAV